MIGAIKGGYTMIISFKKIIPVFLALFFSLYCAIGLGTSVSEETAEYDNVILMIGDGMGENTLGWTRQLYGTSLAMDTMPVHASSDTRSFIFDYTDSAAGGTALACGIRVWINSLAVLPFAPFAPADMRVPLSLTELAKSAGKSAGVVTTDKTSGATPAAFSSHVIGRGLEAGISMDQLKGDLDLIWGCDTASVNAKNCKRNGFTHITTREEMQSIQSGERSFAQFNFDEMKNCVTDGDTPSIAEMTAKAIDLLDDNENGFFLMVEGACIDKFSHDNDEKGATMNVMAFDEAIKVALDYAKADGNTLVVVTADHETGGIVYDEKTDTYRYTIGKHSTQNVPVFVSAEDAGFQNGQEVENRQISVQIARAMGFGADQFPAIKGYSFNK